MERDDTRNTRSPCERARLHSGEVVPFGSEFRVLLQKRGLDEELVGAARKLGDFCDIRFVEGCVDYVC